MVRYVYASPGVTEQVQTVFTGQKKAMEMEVNGRDSCTGKLRPIYIRCFLIKEQVYK